MKMLLIMFEDETFPDSRWGTYGSHSVFVEEVFDSEWYDDLKSMQERMILDIAEFKAKNPHGTVSVYNIKDNDDCENIIVEAENKANEIIKQKEKEEKELAKQQLERAKEKRIQEDLKKLEELKAKYENH